MSGEVMKHSDVPLYRQVVTILRGQIADGHLRPGDKLPSEPELCEMYSVSRATIRQAMNELDRDGLIERAAGKGTFLLPPPIPTWGPTRHRMTLPDILSELQKRPQVLLNCGSSVPPPVVSQELGLAPELKVPFAIRVVKDGAVPWAAVKHYVIPRLAAPLIKLSKRPGAIPTMLAAANDLPHKIGASWSEAIVAEPRFAMMLKVPLGSPILSVWWLDMFGRQPGVCTQMLFSGPLFAFSGG
jgi:GntR family transcriptional regulator